MVVFAGGDGERQERASAYHLLRAGLLLERCCDGKVRRVGTPLRNDHSWETGKQLAGEWLAAGAALTLQRSC